MKGIILQILYASKRDALFIGTTFLVICFSALSCFLGSMALVEAQEARIVYTAGTSRIAVIIGFTIFIIFYIKRLFENHEIEVILSHSISRQKIILGFFAGFSVILLTLLLPVLLILTLLKTPFTSTLIWCLSVYLEGLVVLSFAICCGLMIKSQVLSLSTCFLLYLISRTIGNFVAYIELSAKIDIMSVFASILKVISIVIPRFDLFGKTSWLIYNDISINDCIMFVVQSLIFCGIFISMAIIDFRKKEF